MNKEKYISPEMEIIFFETEDVIVASYGNGGPIVVNGANKVFYNDNGEQVDENGDLI